MYIFIRISEFFLQIYLLDNTLLLSNNSFYGDDFKHTFISSNSSAMNNQLIEIDNALYTLL
jgi:hypothetical protein